VETLEYLLLSRKMGETSLGVREGGRKASGGGYNQNSTLKTKIENSAFDEWCLQHTLIRVIIKSPLEPKKEQY